MESILSQIFTSDYNRTAFEDNVLKPVFLNSVKDFKLFDEDGEQEVTLSETEKRTAKKVVKYGEFKTHDNRNIDLYEVTIQDFSQVKIARVGLGAIVRKLIIGNNAVFATFKYENTTNKRWRFSFIAYDSFFEEGQVRTKETNPKRYTYVFGDSDESYRTAIDRFQELDHQFQIKVKDIQEAFAVEAMSKEFFDEYRETHYAKFVKFLTGEEFKKKGGKFQLVEVQNPSPFLASVFNGDKKDARDFCKKLLGQIVFLYFIQKKGWLGATNTNYKEGNGDKNFIQNFYKQAGENDTFYTVWLSKLFYDTLNNGDRNDDDFTMPDGTVVKIPYLNGGLFEKESEKFDYLVFPSELFTDLFEFFNRFNFTIYENSPEEHTVAVDPEMLGHIFENLLEDNKDKGAFYTPKEIVQYMTQESLIEYLVTHLGRNAKEDISQFVKQKNKGVLSDNQFNEIDNLLDKVKICDPAIGSGAFPMGLLQEIFALKERIAFDTNSDDWNPATVKENIIQNSIYGVDIEKGAVDIAQLRFWLSLIVDEEEPKPLPNLAYKIVVGNSLVSKFGDEVIEIDWEVDEGTQNNLFGNPYQEEIQDLLKRISEKQKEYFTANNNNKPRLTKEIRLLKLNILSKQLELMINTKGFDKVGSNKLSKSQTERWLETEGWKRTLQQVNVLKTNNNTFNHFDWRLDFPEILNPIVNENTGFDIIIGNPPYIESKKLTKEDKDVFKNYLTASGKFDVFCLFIELSKNIINQNGIHCYINPTTFFNKDYGKALRSFIANKFEVLEIFDFNDYQVFPTAITYTGIFILKNTNSEKDTFTYQKLNGLQRTSKLKNIFLEKSSSYFKSVDNILVEDLYEDNWVFINPKIKKIKLQIESIGIPLKKLTEYIFVGIQSGKDEVFFVDDFQIEKYNLERDLIFPILKGKDVRKYSINWSGKYIIYPYNKINNKVIPESEMKTNYPNLYKYLFESKDKLKGRSYFDKSNKIWYELWCERNFQKFNQIKIINAEIAPNNRFQIDTNSILGNTKIFSTVLKEDYFDRYYELLGMLNSKLFNFYHKLIASPKAGGFFDYKTQFIEKYPIVFSDNMTIDLISKIILELNDEKILSSDIKAKISFFESIIDGCIFDMYFEEHMKVSNLSITHMVEKEINYVFGKNGFSNINNRKNTKSIWELYEVLSHPDHPVRNKILKFPIVSPNILKPILQS